MNRTYRALDSRNDLPQRVGDILLPMLNEHLTDLPPNVIEAGGASSVGSH